MNGHVFQCYGESTTKNQFTRTMSELETYIGSQFKGGSAALLKMVRTNSETVFVPPPTPAVDDKGAMDVGEREIWKGMIAHHIRDTRDYESNKGALSTIVWGQCSQAMQAKLRRSENFSKFYDSNDFLAMIAEIKGVSYKFESRLYPDNALHRALLNFYNIRQMTNETPSDYMNRYKDTVAVIDHYGGSIGEHTALVLESAGGKLPTDPRLVVEAQVKSKERYLAYCFLLNADPGRYSCLLEEMENSHAFGKCLYPATITDAYNMLMVYKKTFAPPGEGSRGRRRLPPPLGNRLRPRHSRMSSPSPKRQLGGEPPTSGATTAKRWGTTPAPALLPPSHGPMPQRPK
jgi:hypothetical protein